MLLPTKVTLKLTGSEYYALLNVVTSALVNEPDLTVVNCSVNPPEEVSIRQLFNRVSEAE